MHVPVLCCVALPIAAIARPHPSSNIRIYHCPFIDVCAVVYPRGNPSFQLHLFITHTRACILYNAFDTTRATRSPVNQKGLTLIIYNFASHARRTAEAVDAYMEMVRVYRESEDREQCERVLSR
jgi:hypothetical protein